MKGDNEKMSSTILNSTNLSVPLHLSNLISSVHSQHNEKDAHFEYDVLLDLAPDDIYAFMVKKVYGILIPTAEKNPKK